MTDRERFLKCILGEKVDRPPFWLLWGPWGRAWQRWEREGKPKEITDHRSFMNPEQPPFTVPVNCGPSPKFERKVFEENEEYVVFNDEWGIKRRDYKKGESMSQFLEFPVKTREDWKRYKKERFNPDDPRRLDGSWREACKEWVSKGVAIQLGYFPDVGIFGSVRWLLGDEECLVAFYTAPELVRDIMDHMTTVYLAVFEKVVKETRVDIVHIWEDMCGRQGPLISPKHWKEFMGPCYRRIKDFTRKHNIPVMSVDTDGYPDLIIPVMMEHGVNYLWPFEVAAGCDVNYFGNKYPSLGMWGGIDKRALAAGKKAIDRELERIRPAMEKGRYIPDMDHSIPDDVSWENYLHYAKALKKLIIG